MTKYMTENSSEQTQKSLSLLDIDLRQRELDRRLMQLEVAVGFLSMALAGLAFYLILK
jgi:hypothetical protein